MRNLILLAKNEPLETRLIVCAVACVFGVGMILLGRRNIQTQQAEESGKRRTVNNLMGQSNSYTGSKAVLVGWVRVIGGVMVIVFGFVFLVFGSFLAP